MKLTAVSVDLVLLENNFKKVIIVGKARFPLINARKDIFGKWHTYPYVGEGSETIVVPSEPNEFGYYTAWLLEIPDQNVRVRIEGLKERTENASASTLAQDEFYVNYQTGEVLCTLRCQT